MSCKLELNTLQCARAWIHSILPPHEAQDILFFVLGIDARSRAEAIFATSDQPLEIEIQQKLIEITRKRKKGEPLQYLIGHQQFLSHYYQVGPGVLIPRPETEVLVNCAVETLQKMPSSYSRLGFELGLGSGIISIELIFQFASLQMIATESSQEALFWANKNVETILSDQAKSRLRIIHNKNVQDIWSSFSTDKGVADFFISNPPYLDPDGDETDLDVLQYEPHGALFPQSKDPNCYYQEIANEIQEFVKSKGWVFLEIPHQRAEEIQDIFMGKARAQRLVPDLTGRPRVLVIQLR